MKTKKFIKASTFSICSVAALAVLSTSTIASAEVGDSTTQIANKKKKDEEKKASTIWVTVPTTGVPLQYKNAAGETVTVALGATVILPKGATFINIPADTLVTAVNSKGTSATYKVETPLVMPSIDAGSVNQALPSMVLQTLTQVKGDTTTVTNIAEGTQTVTKGDGTPKVTTLPISSESSPLVKRIEKAADKALSTAVEKNTVDGAPVVTDGN